MFKIPGGLGDMLKQAQQLQQGMSELKTSLESTLVDGGSSDGLVRVTASAAFEIKQVIVDPILIDRVASHTMSPTELAELIQRATNDALGKAKEVAKQEVSKLTGGLSIPGLG